MEETISLREIFQTLKKRLALIISITIAAMLISALISFFVLTPTYESSTQILVNKTDDNSQSLYTGNQVQTNVQLINTYSVIIKSPTVLEDVVKNLNLDTTADALSNQLSVNSSQDSQVFTLSVTNTDPKLAAKIANETASVFQEKIQDLMKIDNVNAISKASVPKSPVKPNPMLNIAIAFVVGLMVSVGLAFLLEYLDTTVKTEEDIEKLLGTPVLGVIATIDDTDLRISQRSEAAQQELRREANEA